MSRESPEVQALFDLIAECLSLAVEFDGVVYRSAGVKYANEKDLISGEGAAYYGGRWNPPKVKAIYAATDLITATKESYQEFQKYGFKNSVIKPRVMAGLKIKAHSVFDLTDARIRRNIGFNLKELLQEDWNTIQFEGDESWTQAIGRGCRESGFEGLIVPSSRNHQGSNIVIFPDKLHSESSIELMSKEELPPHPSKW